MVRPACLSCFREVLTFGWCFNQIETDYIFLFQFFLVQATSRRLWISCFHLSSRFVVGMAPKFSKPSSSGYIPTEEASSNTDRPKIKYYSFNVKKLPIDENTIRLIENRFSSMSPEELEEQETMIHEQMIEALVFKQFMKEKKKSMASEESKKKSKEKQMMKRAVESQKTHEEREKEIHIVVFYNNEKYEFDMKGKCRIGTLRASLAREVGGKPSKKFVWFYGNPKGEQITADPVKTLRGLDFKDGQILTAEDVEGEEPIENASGDDTQIEIPLPMNESSEEDASESSSVVVDDNSEVEQ